MANTSEKPDFRADATQALIDALEKGTAPWQMPWDKQSAVAMMMPINGATGRAYNGANAVNLLVKNIQRRYTDPRWLTFNQAREKGWQIKKGAKASHVEFWQFEKKESDEAGQQVTTKLERPWQKLYAVFNAEQIEGIPPFEAAAASPDWQVHQSAEAALSNSGAHIKHGGVSAYYMPGLDQIVLPPKQTFTDQAAYYGTALHELAHWTGHASRLNREGITAGQPFGSEVYAKEELRAEMASLFLQIELGVPHDPNRHASYVDSWISILKQDKNELFRAAKDASAAADYIVALSKEKALDAPSVASAQESAHITTMRLATGAMVEKGWPQDKVLALVNSQTLSVLHQASSPLATPRLPESTKPSHPVLSR